MTATKLDAAFALTVLAAAGLDPATASIVDMIDTIGEAIAAARPDLNDEEINKVADQLAFTVAR